MSFRGITTIYILSLVLQSRRNGALVSRCLYWENDDLERERERERETERKKGKIEKEGWRYHYMLFESIQRSMHCISLALADRVLLFDVEKYRRKVSSPWCNWIFNENVECICSSLFRSVVRRLLDTNIFSSFLSTSLFVKKLFVKR